MADLYVVMSLNGRQAVQVSIRTSTHLQLGGSFSTLVSVQLLSQLDLQPLDLLSECAALHQIEEDTKMLLYMPPRAFDVNDLRHSIVW
jgi:hypothetical protein